MHVRFFDDKSFAGEAAMRSHYAAVRRRLFPTPAPAVRVPLAPPRQSDQARPMSDRVSARIARHKRTVAAVAELKDAKDDAERVIRMSAAHFGVSIDDIVSAKKTRTFVDARFVAAFLMTEVYRCLAVKTEFRQGWSWIAPRLNRDHTTIMHAVRRVENSPRLLEHARKVRNQLLSHLTDGAHYVQGSHYVRVDPEAFTLKRRAFSFDLEA
jgi:hypothetical protein